MENGNLEMPCKIRKRRFPTGSSSSFANSNLSQLLLQKTDSPRNEKCIDRLDRSTCKADESRTMTLQESGADNRVNEVFEKSNSNSNVYPQVIYPDYGHPLICDSKSNEGKSRPCGATETETDGNQSMPKPRHGLEEIKHSLTISKELLKLLNHIWTADTNHTHHHPTSLSLASTLNQELTKARSHVNKLIQEQRSTNTSSISKEQDKVRFAVKTIAQELEAERKLRRQIERMNKKLGRELASTKASLAEAEKRAESEKQAMEVLEELCEKMAHSIEEDRVELEELKKESERVREEMEEEREMLRVADMLREERLHMKLIDAKYEYEDKHEQMNTLVHDLEELLEADDSIEHLKRTPKVLTWYQSKNKEKNRSGKETTHSLWHESEENKDKVVNDVNALGEGTRDLSWYQNIVNNNSEDENDSLWYTDNESDNHKVVNDENTLGGETRGLSWYEDNMGEVNDEATNTQNEVIGRNSDCIEWEFGLDMKDECPEEKILGFSSSSTIKEYEDEMERYKMIKDLRDRIVSGSDLS